MELRLEERGALDSSCWRWVGREACRDRAPPTGEMGGVLRSGWLEVEVSGYVGWLVRWMQEGR